MASAAQKAAQAKFKKMVQSKSTKVGKTAASKAKPAKKKA